MNQDIDTGVDGGDFGDLGSFVVRPVFPADI